MMIDVLVHENGPLLRFEWAEERVPVTGAARGPLTCKPVDCCYEHGSFALELALCRIRRQQLRRRRRVATHRLVVAEDQGLDKRAEQGGGKWCTLRLDDTHRHFNASGAVGESLSDRHAAPLPLALRTQSENALFRLLHQDWVKKVFHLSWSRSNAGSSAAPASACGFDRGDVNLPHRHHRIHRALGGGTIRVRRRCQ